MTNIKKLLALIIYCGFSYANETALYGTTDNPQINGSSYDVHKTFIEPNAGFQPEQSLKNQDESQKQVVNTSTYKKTNKQNISFSSDNWALNSNVERVLKNAASEGKLSYVLDQAKKADLPSSVAIVPMVESNYRKDAISNKGAGGAWQIMQSTAHDYGLSADKRFDFNSSTDVAIQILNDLHNEFGNWALAFSAYNCGSGCVLKALKQNPNAKDIDDLNLPKETKDYVHKIIAMNQIIAGLDKQNQLAQNQVK